MAGDRLVGGVEGHLDDPPGAVVELGQERDAGGVGEHHPRARREGADHRRGDQRRVPPEEVEDRVERRRGGALGLERHQLRRQLGQRPPPAGAPGQHQLAAQPDVLLERLVLGLAQRRGVEVVDDD